METTFRYESLRAMVLAVTCGDLIAIVTGISSALRGGIGGAVFSLVAFAACSLVGVALMLHLSDVVVTDKGLSRRLWGRTIREIPWTNIERVKVRPGHDPDPRRSIRVFSVVPAKPKDSRLERGGQIWFAEHGDFRAVIEHMNRHILANGIRVEVTKDRNEKTWTTVDRIDSVA